MISGWRGPVISGIWALSKWNHTGASIRDRVDSGFDIRVNSTALLADMAGQGALPDQAMITVHPQRWNDRAVPWVRELVWQNVKNGVKRVGVRLGWGQSCVIAFLRKGPQKHNNTRLTPVRPVIP